MSTIADKIRALLAKAARTDNPHEGDAFYAKAHELMAKFNIEEDALGTKSDLVKGNDRYGNDKWEWVLTHCVAKLIGVTVLMHPTTSQRYFGGRPTNVEMAEELYKHYEAQVTKYYKLALPKGLTKAKRGIFRRNFREGACEVIWGRVCDIVAANARALIVSPVQLEAEAKELTGGAEPKKSKSLVIKHDSAGTHAGRIAGALIELGKEIRQ